MNNKLKWLFSSSSALYPSVYIYDKQPWNKAFVHGRLEEAFRVATMASIEIKRRLPVFPYFRHLYEGKPTEFDFLSDVRSMFRRFFSRFLTIDVTDFSAAILSQFVMFQVNVSFKLTVKFSGLGTRCHSSRHGFDFWLEQHSGP